MLLVEENQAELDYFDSYGKRSPGNKMGWIDSYFLETRTEILSKDELWDWCKRVPYFVCLSKVYEGRVALAHRSQWGEKNPVVMVEGRDALAFPLMVARARKVALDVTFSEVTLPHDLFCPGWEENGEVAGLPSREG